MITPFFLSQLPSPAQYKTDWPWMEVFESLPDHMPNGLPWPKISIITPSYNQAQYLEETIRSVLLQNYPNLEYIIIDGGSTDGSLEIIKKYQPWLAYWESEKDRGQSHAINKGWKKSTGEILYWLNSDDFLMPNILVKVAKAFQDHPEAGIVHAKAVNVDHNSEKTGTISGQAFEIISSFKTLHNPIAQPATFIHRRALLIVGYLDEELHQIFDWDYWLRIGLEFPGIFIDEYWAAFRIWPGSKGSTNYSRSHVERLKVIKKIVFTIKPKQVRLKDKIYALAAAYGGDALFRYKNGERFLFRLHLLLSLLLYPTLRGGKAKNLVPELFLGKLLVHWLTNVKKFFNRSIIRIKDE